MKVKLLLNFTTSKFLAYLILLIGSAYAFVYKEPSVLIATFSAASAVIALKTYTTSRERIKYYENPNNTQSGYDETPPDDV